MRCERVAATSGPRPLPMALRAINVVGRRRSPRAFEPDELLHAAQRKTGLDDVGAGLAIDGLERLCRALDEEAELTPTGRMLARSQIIGALGNRLQIVDWLRQHPETFEERIERPVFIVGLPRTGTTILHRLLAADPAHRAARWWQGAEPCPPPAAVREDPDPRIARAERALRLVNVALPDLRRIHEVAAQAPEECVQLMGNDLVSLVYAIQFWVPSYWRWLEEIDLTTAYAAHRNQRQILQWGTTPRRWIGKAPAHLFALPALLVAYPDAVIVQTHREPIAVVASTCSLLEHTYRATTDQVTPLQIGSLVCDRLALWQQRFCDDRADAAGQSPGATFVDVSYPHLVADPLAELERLYDAASLPWTVGVRRTAEVYLASHPQHAHGVHHYDLARFGLTEAEVCACSSSTFADDYAIVTLIPIRRMTMSVTIDPEFAQHFLNTINDPGRHGVHLLFNQFWRFAPDEVRDAYVRPFLDDPALQGHVVTRHYPEPLTLDRLAAAPAASLGEAVHTFIEANGLEQNLATNYRAFHDMLADAGMLDGMPEELRYAVLRGFQLHDLIHVVTGYGPDPQGEIALQAFCLAQLQFPYFAMWMSVITTRMTFIEPRLIVPMMDAISDGWAFGRSVPNIQFEHWEEHLDEPLGVLRQSFGILPTGRRALVPAGV